MLGDGSRSSSSYSFDIPYYLTSLVEGLVYFIYAEDADGNKIPINIDGSKLLIDGVEVTAGGDSTQVTTNKNNIATAPT